jgi:stage V sporulation protein G
MRITEVQINLVKPNNGLIGFASLVVNGEIYISSIAIHKRLNSTGYRLTYPSKGNFTIFHPINRNTSTQIEEAVFLKLKNVMKKVNIDAEEAF